MVSCAIVSRPLRLPSKPNFGLPEGINMAKFHGPNGRQAWRELSPEIKEKMEQFRNDVHEGFNNVLTQMPKALYLILR